jgi:hypothetical protein
MNEPDDHVCQGLEVDGEPIAIHGQPGPLSEQDVEAFTAITRAARAMFDLEPGKALVQELSSAVRLAAACIPDGDVDTGLYGHRDGGEVRQALKDAAKQVRAFMRDQAAGTAARATVGSPEDGHQFHFAVDIQSSDRVGDGPRTDAPGPMGLPFQLTVRAWNLPDACRPAAEMSLGKWSLGGETELEALPEGTEDGEASRG